MGHEVKTRPIKAQSAAIARAMASICNAEWARFGGMSGHGRFVRTFSVIGALCLAAAGVAQAQSVSTEVQASHDSDGLDQRSIALGTATSGGWGVKGAAMRFTAPGGWAADGQLLAATYQRATQATQFNAAAGVARVGRHDHAVGSLDVLHALGTSGGSALGLSAQRSVLDSRAGIDAGLTYDSAAVVADHAFSQRFNVGMVGGATWFSDGNRRPLLRTRWNLSLHEGSGLNAYIKTRSYRNSDPYRPEYFSPERLNEASLGLSVRFAAAGRTVLSAALDAGRQHTELDVEPIWSFSLGISSARAARVQWSLAVQAAHTAALMSSTSTYRYTSVVGRISVPL